MTQLKRILWFAVFAGVLLLLQGRAGAQTSNGALKVTSFPVGANVSVDGVDTGKVTPMSISLTVGTHTVVVSIPNSGWNPDTRTVEVVAGNNDLSVTLLPILTTGPPGAPGAAATIQIGNTTTLGANGQASVTNVGTSNAAVLNFAIPQGQTGATGPSGAAATVAVGTTTPGPPGTSALVTNAGSSSAALLNFVIPQGATGAQGQPGSQGVPGPPGIGAPLIPNFLSNPANGVTVTGPFVNSNVAQALEFDITVAAGVPDICSAIGMLAYTRTDGTGAVTSVNEVIDLLQNQPKAAAGSTVPQVAEYFGPADKIQNISFTPVRIIPCSAGLSAGTTTSVTSGWDLATNKPF